MNNTAIHPKVAEISYIANDAYARKLIERLNQKDEGRSKSRHKAAIQEIKKFHTEYKLGAEQYLTPGYTRKQAALDTVGFVIFMAALIALYVMGMAGLG